MDSYRPISLPSASPHLPHDSDSGQAYIPTKRPKNNIPIFLRWWAVGATTVLMVALALAIEAALYFSNKRQGFPVGRLNTEQVQWLSGFLPTLAIGLLVWLWRCTDNGFKKLQPYVVLSQGPARAEESILLDLEHGNFFSVLGAALKNGQFLILGSSVICLVNILLHPLAGAFFLVKPGVITIHAGTSVHSTASLALNPSYGDLTFFSAAAGYAEAAALYNLSDPPFVSGGWAVASFQFPLDITRGATLTIPTTAVYTNVSCSAASVDFNPPTSSAPQNWTLAASFPVRGPGCAAMQPIDSTAGGSQFGVDLLPECTNINPTKITSRDVTINPFAGVLFWFASIPTTRTAPSNGTTVRRATGTPLGNAISCIPTITAHSVEAVVDGMTGLLLGVNVTGGVNGNNNVTEGGFAGKAFNGVFFNNATDDFDLNNPFINARALAVQSIIPGAIFGMADQAGRLDATFNESGFLGLTEKVYTQYLSMVALSTYFVPDDTSLNADISLWPERLWISPVTAHVLAALLVLVAFAGVLIHIIHSRQRKRLYLASSPGSMAHYMGLLSHPQLVSHDVSGKGAPRLVGPLDDAKAMQRKLHGTLFMLDQVGRVVPVIAGETLVSPNRHRESWRGGHSRGASEFELEYELEDPRKSLLSPRIEHS